MSGNWRFWGLGARVHGGWRGGEEVEQWEREGVLGGSREGEEEKLYAITKIPIPFCSFYFKPINNKHR